MISTRDSKVGKAVLLLSCSKHRLKPLFIMLVLKFEAIMLELTHERVQDKKVLKDNIERHARSANVLFIWTDCDREGEHIGSEVRDVALKINRSLQVKRAKFSNIERASVNCCLPTKHLFDRV